MKNLMMLSIVAVLSVGFDVREPQTVEVSLVAGMKFDAEILFVRDTTVVLTTAVGASEEDLMFRNGAIQVVRDKDIVGIRTKGSAHTVLGAGLGALVGGALGMAIGGSQSVTQDKNDIFGCGAGMQKESNTVSGGAIGCAGGCLLGAIVGGATGSGSDLISAQQRDFKVLWRYQRYAAEPDYLKQPAK